MYDHILSSKCLYGRQHHHCNKSEKNYTDRSSKGIQDEENGRNQILIKDSNAIRILDKSVMAYTSSLDFCDPNFILFFNI
jgi:hypothetical protein